MEITRIIYYIKKGAIFFSALGIFSICSDMNARKLVSQKLILENDINKYSWVVHLRNGYGRTHGFRASDSYGKDYELLVKIMNGYDEEILFDMHEYSIVDMNRVVVPDFDDEIINQRAVEYRDAIEQYNEDVREYHQLEKHRLTIGWLNSWYLFAFIVSVGLQLLSTVLEYKSSKK